MPQNLFHLAERIIADVKYFPCSRNDIEHELNDENGQCEKESEHFIDDGFGNKVVATLRLNVNCRSPYPQGWTISIKMHDVRIDGIDWHARFTDPDGNKHSGWHRHHYDARAMTADPVRRPVIGFHNVVTRSDFLIRALKEMRVVLDTVDYGTQTLQFD